MHSWMYSKMVYTSDENLLYYRDKFCMLYAMQTLFVCFVLILMSLCVLTAASWLSIAWHAGGWWFDPRLRQTQDINI